MHCPDWERGPGASLRCGLRGLAADAEAAVVVLADGPRLDPRAVDRVVDAWRAGAAIGSPPPTTASTARIPSCSRAPHGTRIPDEGARALDVALVNCADLSPPGDVDYAY